MLTMPSVLGQNYDEAVLTLTVAGVYVPVPSYAFLPEQITVQWQRAEGAGGIVLAQAPASGIQVNAGAPITLTVSNFPMASVIGD